MYSKCGNMGPVAAAIGPYPIAPPHSGHRFADESARSGSTPSTARPHTLHAGPGRGRPPRAVIAATSTTPNTPPPTSTAVVHDACTTSTIGAATIPPSSTRPASPRQVSQLDRAAP